MLYIDLDGVLADFITGVSQEIWLLATNRKEIVGSKSAPRKIRQYIKTNGRSFKIQTEQSLKQKETKAMLYLAASQKGFFLNLETLPTRLLEEVQTLGVDYQFLTAGIGTHSIEDKQEWCRTVLGSNNECNVVISGNGKSTAELKAEFCKTSDDILVDDTKKNIDAWRQAGGVGVHWTGSESLQELITILNQSSLQNCF
jgi:beta-phosphoglucomutase-like phosphatase (HAD superfamily)